MVIGSYPKSYTCTLAMVTKYQKRIFDLLLDHIDTHIETYELIMKNSVEIGWMKPALSYASGFKQREIFSISDSASQQI